jgi:thioredoxin 1
MSAGTIKVTEATFDEVVGASDRPVLVDFWADWCGPCHMVAPVLEAIASEHADRLIVAKLDVDRNPRIAQRYGVMSIPTLILFQDGEVSQRIVGALPKPALEARLGDVLAGAVR